MKNFELELSEKFLSAIQKFILDKVSKMKNNFSEFGGILLGSFTGHKLIVRDFIYDDKATATMVQVRFSHEVFRKTRSKLIIENQNAKGQNEKLLNLGTWHVHPPGYSCQYSQTDYETIFQEKIWTQTGNPMHIASPRVHAIFEANPNTFAFYTIEYKSQFNVVELNKSNNLKYPKNELNELQKTLLNSGNNENHLIYKSDNKFKLIRYDLFDNTENFIGLCRYTNYLETYSNFEYIFLTNFYINTKEEKPILYTLVNKENSICQFYEVTPIKVNNNEPLNNVRYDKITSRIIHEDKTLMVGNPFDVNQAIDINIKNQKVSDLSEIIKKKFDISVSPSFYIMLDYYYVDFISQLKAQKTEFINKFKVLQNNLQKIIEKIVNNNLIYEQNGKLYLTDDMYLNDIYYLTKDTQTIYFETSDLNPELIYKLRTHRMQLSGYNIGKLSTFKVFIGGVGLLGNEILINLSVIGLRKFTIIDYGSVDWYNIYRQPLFNKDNIYIKKVNAAKMELENYSGIEINPLDIEVPCLSSNSNKSFIFNQLDILSEEIKKSDIVVGAFDIKSARSVLQILALYHNKTFISSALDGAIASSRLHRPHKDACYCCGTSFELSDGGACTLSRISTQKIIGGISADMIVEYLNGKLIYDYNEIRYNAIVNKMLTKKIAPSRNCPVCQNENLANYSKDELFNFIYNWLFD